MANPVRILIWDIESSDLVADFGTIICIGWKWLGEKEPVHIQCLSDFPRWKQDVTDDKRLVQAFYPRLIEADMMVTYFGTGFDKKMVQSKLLEHGLAPPPNTPHVDLFYTVKSNMVLSRKRLENVSEFLGCPTKKTPIKPKVWKRAQAGYPEAIEYVTKHCHNDVLITEYTYLKLRPYARQHPRVGSLQACRHCGELRLTNQGYSLTTTKGKRRRVQCQACGAWDTVSLKEWETTKEAQRG